MNIAKKLVAFGLGASFLAMAGVALAAPVPTAPGQNKLQCFDGTTDGGFGGICTTSNGAKGPATLNNTDTNANGDYAGVYVLNSTLFGAALSSITQLGYNYSGTVAPMPGNLSLNLPVDTDGDVSTTEGYAFIDAYYCPGTDGNVNVIGNSTCGIWYQGIEYANWNAFMTAFPTGKVADQYAFVIAERTPTEVAASWTVNNIKLGKAGK